MTVLVTGGSGVVGGPVIRMLAEEGETVRALARSSAAAEQVARMGAEPVAGDLLDYPSLVAAMEEIDVVYHLAGLNQLCPPRPELLYQINVDGTRHVVRAAAAAGVRRLVHTSSAVTIGEEPSTVASEDSPHRHRFGSHYERSKYQAEQVALGERTPVEVVVVNPASVQGPGRSTGTGRLILDLVNGRLPFLVDAPISIVDIDDCARGHLLAARRGVPGRRYLLSGFTLSTPAAVNLLERLTGTPVRVRYLPGRLALAGATVIGALGRAIGRPPPVCLEMARALVHGHRYDGSRATRELGLDYRAPEETVGRMLAWFEEQGLLDRRRRTG